MEVQSSKRIWFVEAIDTLKKELNAAGSKAYRNTVYTCSISDCTFVVLAVGEVAAKMRKELYPSEFDDMKPRANDA